MVRISEDEARRLNIAATASKRKINDNISKYHSRKVEYTEPETGEKIKFDSKKEFNYYLLLKDRLKRGEISNLQRQVKIEIQPAFTSPAGIKNRAIYYIADFVFYDYSCKTTRIIDVKGFKTDVYKLKKKIAEYKGFYIEEI